MAEYLIQSETLDDIADAINAKTGGASAMTPAEMVTEIGTISTGGGGQQKVLLASGTYTQASNSTVIIIPVTVPAGATEAYIEADTSTIDTSTNYALAMYFVRDYQQIAKNVFQSNIQRGMGIHAQTGTKVYSDPRGGLDPSRIYGYGGYTVKAGTYNWYIWGYAE